MDEKYTVQYWRHNEIYTDKYDCLTDAIDQFNWLKKDEAITQVWLWWSNSVLSIYHKDLPA